MWVGDLLARAVVGGLFLALAANLFDDFLRTGHLTGLLLLASELLVALFTMARRRTLDVNRSPTALLLTGTSVLGPALLRATTGNALVPDALTVSVSAVGLMIVVAGKLTLGRSFGIVPANRGVVTGGPYDVVRHPIYLGYMITHLAFLVAHPLASNLIVIIIADTALVARALVEERTLVKDDR